MRLAGGIAHKHDAVALGPAPAWPQGTCRQPAPHTPRTAQHFANASAMFPDMTQYGLTSLARARHAQLGQLIAPHTARKTDASLVAMDHSAVAARKGQERHQIGIECRVFEMRLEAEQMVGQRF